MILHGTVQFPLHGTGSFVDLFQVYQKRCGDVHHQPQDELCPELGLDIPHPSADYIIDDLVLPQRNGKNIMIGQDNAQRHGIKNQRVVFLHFRNGCVHDDQRLVFLLLHTGRFFFVQ